MAPAELERYIRAWRERFAEAGAERRERAGRARALLPAVVGHLVERRGVRRVWLFGSLAEAGIGEWSDIDLAAEGLPGGSALFRAAQDGVAGVGGGGERGVTNTGPASATRRAKLWSAARKP
jgi:hypothetical protein